MDNSKECERAATANGRPSLNLDRFGKPEPVRDRMPRSGPNSSRAKMSSASPRIALFIDGANLYATAKTLGFDIDYKRLLKEFQGRGELLRAFYYTAIIEDQEFS